MSLKDKKIKNNDEDELNLIFSSDIISKKIIEFTPNKIHRYYLYLGFLLGTMFGMSICGLIQYVRFNDPIAFDLLRGNYPIWVWVVPFFSSVIFLFYYSKKSIKK